MSSDFSQDDFELEEEVILVSGDEDEELHPEPRSESESLRPASGSGSKVFDVMERFGLPGESADEMVRRVGVTKVCREVARAEAEGFVIRGDESLRVQQPWRAEAATFIGALEKSSPGRLLGGSSGGLGEIRRGRLSRTGTSTVGTDRLLGGNAEKFSRRIGGRPSFKRRGKSRRRSDGVRNVEG
mmetsp:Transcript_3490/g.6567  ORF Transcript_3490/g.6567 Transcript_3490/m.6567 type:complete len:185 (-) Transcript_3490:1534-2088(-)